MSKDVPLKEKYKKKFNKAIFFFAVFILPSMFLRIIDKYGVVSVHPVILRVADKILVILAAFLVASLLVRFSIKYFVRWFSDSVEAEQRILLLKTYSFFIYVLTLIFVFWQLGVSAQNLSIILGFTATGVAFAVRDIIMSFLAWFIILIKKPFRIGDYIKIGDERGRVEHVGTFFVRLLDDPDNPESHFRVPNKTFMEKSIQNFGRRKLSLSLSIPLTKVNSTLYGKLSDLERELSVKIGYAVEASLQPQGDKWFVNIMYLVPFSEKDKIKETIIEESLKELKAYLSGKK